MVEKGHFQELTRILDLVVRQEKQGGGHTGDTDPNGSPNGSPNGAGGSGAKKATVARRGAGGWRKRQTLLFSATLTLDQVRGYHGPCAGHNRHGFRG